MYQEFGIKENIINLANEVEEEIKSIFEEINNICEQNSLKVLQAFQENHISDMHFNSTTGYGYGDVRKRSNRENICKGTWSRR